jgi:hypothetical protein
MENFNNGIRGGTVCLGNAGLVMDTDGEEDVETTANFPYAINGLVYTCTSDDGDVKFDGNTVTAGYTALFLVCIDADGDITVVKGTEVDNDDITAGTKVLHWPVPTANTCPIGAVKIKNASSAVFTGGTTDLDATDITTTCYNFFTIPEAPLAS